MNNKFTRKEIGKLVKSNYYIVRNPELDARAIATEKINNRLLIITSCKVGNAVQRNKVRRRIKSIFYEEKLNSKFNIKLDVAIFCKPKIKALNFIDTKKLILKIFDQLSTFHLETK